MMECEILSAAVAGLAKGSAPMERAWNALKKQARL